MTQLDQNYRATRQAGRCSSLYFRANTTACVSMICFISADAARPRVTVPEGAAAAQARTSSLCPLASPDRRVDRPAVLDEGVEVEGPGGAGPAVFGAALAGW